MRSLALVWVLVLGCGAQARDLEVVRSLPESCLGGQTVDEVRVSALGDFPPVPAHTAQLAPDATVRLELPAGTRTIAVEGRGSDALVAFGRTAPLDVSRLALARVAVAYGRPDGLCPARELNFARAGHQATLLPSGNVLISGGVDADGVALQRLELYLPSGDALTPPATFRIVDVDGPTALDPRAVLGHAVAVLANGEVLITGGAPAQGGQASGIAFEGVTRHGPDGTLLGPPGIFGGGPRAFHSATRLADGRVVFIGGCSDLVGGACAAGRTEGGSVLYDPRGGGFSAGPMLLRPRFGHDAILRGDGSILIVGGRGEGGVELPLELFDPDEQRGFDAGSAAGRGVLLPTGAVALAGAAGGAPERAALWLSAEEVVELQPVSAARAGHTLTALEDGAWLLAGGGPLEVVDGRGEPHALEVFGRLRHTATRLLDGTVLLAGGAAPAGGALKSAAIFLRSPLGPYSTVPRLAFDSEREPYLPRRPDRTPLAGGRLQMSAPQAGEGGRPGEIALLAGALFEGVTVRVLAGRVNPNTTLALLYGFQSDAAFAWIALEVGRPVAVFGVAPGRAGQSVVSAAAGCTGATLEDDELPVGELAELELSARVGTLQVSSGRRVLLQCTPTPAPGRGRIGVGVLRGTAAFDGLEAGR